MLRPGMSRRRPKIDFLPGETMALGLIRRTYKADPQLLECALVLVRAMDPEAGLGGDHLRGTIQALTKLDTLPDNPRLLGQRIAEGGGSLQKLMEAAWARKATRGGPSFVNF